MSSTCARVVVVSMHRREETELSINQGACFLSVEVEPTHSIGCSTGHSVRIPPAKQKLIGGCNHKRTTSTVAWDIWLHIPEVIQPYHVFPMLFSTPPRWTFLEAFPGPTQRRPRNMVAWSPGQLF